MVDEGIDEMSKLVFGVATALVAWYLIQHSPTAQPVGPNVVPIVVPNQRPTPKPLRPWHDAKVGGDSAPDGTPVQIDMPQNLRMHNTGGRDGSGLCVFTSINHAAIWQNVAQLKDFQKWMKSKPGGG